jgi:tetratricopeptide (TPR) repeat protein
MAISFRDSGDLESADEHELRAIEFAREAANPMLLAQARLGRAEISLRKGDAAFAEAAAVRAASDFADLPEPIQEADALRLVGVAALAQGKLIVAQASLDSALRLARKTGSALNEAEILQARSELHLRLGNRERMREDALAAIAIFERLRANYDQKMLSDWLKENENGSAT